MVKIHGRMGYLAEFDDDDGTGKSKLTVRFMKNENDSPSWARDHYDEEEFSVGPAFMDRHVAIDLITSAKLVRWTLDGDQLVSVQA